MNPELIFKVSLFGEQNVGKQSLVRRYINKEFVLSEPQHVALDIAIKELHIKNVIIVLQIWILEGKAHFKPLTPTYTRGSSVGIFMFDLTRVNTLRTVKEWLHLFKQGQSDQQKEILLLMVGGKVDLSERREVSREQALEYVNSYNFNTYFECSAKENINIKNIFEYIVNYLCKNESFDLNEG